MIIRRRVKVLLAALVLAVVMGWGGWLLVRAQLAGLGIEQLEVSGVQVGWNRLSFETLDLTWKSNSRALRVQTRQPQLTVDWRDWQLDRLVANSTRIEPLSGFARQASAGKPASPAFELTVPDTLPFWLPRHLSINALQASFPCQQTQCRLRGQLDFDRSADRATVRVDATLDRADSTLAIQGDVRLGSGASTGSVTRGELRVTGLGDWLPADEASVLKRFAPTAATVRFSHSGADAEPGDWPISLVLETDGGADLAFDGDVILHTGTPWHLSVTRGRLTGGLDGWRQSDWLLEDVRWELPITGSLSAEMSRLTMGEGGSVRIQHLDPLASETLMWADRAALDPAGLVLTLRDGEFGLQGPLALTAREIRHPALITQAWQLGGNVNWQRRTIARGDITNAAGTRLPFEVARDGAGGLSAALEMTLSPDNQANVLAGTLSHWPENLTLESGRVDASASFRRSPGGELGAEGALVFGQASGLYQNMAWQELDGGVDLAWGKGALTVRADQLVLAQLNPGVSVGPVRVEAAEYRAETDAPASGVFTLATASAGFAGGTLTVADEDWSLAKGPWRVPFNVEGVSLSALMNLYPTEGLAGEGTLAGNLPVMISTEGVSIAGGEISALPPGGRLQLPADKLQAMASGNAAMALVASAMEDFHYRLLESDINYSEDGTLVLGLQLRGSSPKVDSERPVVLNINLEEDIPALLTSLQLSGRVNEAVTERVRERLQQEGGDAR